MRRLCLVYWAVLTILLLTRNPLYWFRAAPPLLKTYRLFDSVTHLVAFTILAFLMLAARWPVSHRRLFAWLAVYAFVTEALQSLIPPRRTDAIDFIEDLIGLGLGAVIWLAADWWFRARRAKHDAEVAHSATTAPR